MHYSVWMPFKFFASAQVAVSRVHDTVAGPVSLHNWHVALPCEVGVGRTPVLPCSMGAAICNTCKIQFLCR